MNPPFTPELASRQMKARRLIRCGWQKHCPTTPLLTSSKTGRKTTSHSGPPSRTAPTPSRTLRDPAGTTHQTAPVNGSGGPAPRGVLRRNTDGLGRETVLSGLPPHHALGEHPVQGAQGGAVEPPGSRR